jgi:hypothetical protein
MTTPEPTPLQQVFREHPKQVVCTTTELPSMMAAITKAGGFVFAQSRVRGCNSHLRLTLQWSGVSIYRQVDLSLVPPPKGARAGDRAALVLARLNQTISQPAKI